MPTQLHRRSAAHHPTRIANAAAYVPCVGDRFHRPAGHHRNPLTHHVTPTPEHTAEVKRVRADHVVVQIDRKRTLMKLKRPDFIMLAKKTLANGARLIRVRPLPASSPQPPK